MPHLILIAVPNGAGKSTSAPGILHGALAVANGSREKVECVTDTAVWNCLREFNDER